MDQNKITDAYKKYFLLIADSITLDINGHTSTSVTNTITYLANVFNRPYTKINRQDATTHEI
jgi:hypothetical protein